MKERIELKSDQVGQGIREEESNGLNESMNECLVGSMVKEKFMSQSTSVEWLQCRLMKGRDKTLLVRKSEGGRERDIEASRIREKMSHCLLHH